MSSTALTDARFIKIKAQGIFVTKAEVRKVLDIRSSKDFTAQVAIVSKQIEGFADKYKEYHHSFRLTRELVRLFVQHIEGKDIIIKFITRR